MKMGVSATQFNTVKNKRETEKIGVYNGAQDYRWNKYVRPVFEKFNFNLGIQARLDDFQFSELRTYIREHFSNFSYQEIAEAFSLYTAHKLEYKESPYGKIAPLFVGNVLNSFKKYQMSLIHDYNMKLKDAEKPQKEATEQEKKQIRYEYITECFLKPYNALKRGGNFSVDEHICIDLFKKFYKAGVITLNQQQLKYWREQAENYYENMPMPEDREERKKVKNLKELVARAKVEGLEQSQDFIKTKATVLCFKHWIKEKAKQNFNMEEFLNTIEL